MIPRLLLHQIVQDDAVRREVDQEVRERPARARGQWQAPAGPELPADFVDVELRRTR